VADQHRWDEVDRYVTDRLVGHDPALAEALAVAADAGLPPIAVSPPQGQLLYLLARAIAARAILELGTLGGYSTIWLARALPDGGRLVTLELEPRHAEVARANLARAGVAERVEVRVGPALDSLAAMDPSEGRFDLVFIDADKPSIPAYFDHALRLAHPGTVIVTDNVVRGGALTDPSSPDPAVRGVRALHDQLSDRPGVVSTTIQTVGSKGYDGFTISLVE
jgi:predicted O-methyltransferase YrrM